MAKHLDKLYKKLSFTEEDDAKIHIHPHLLDDHPSTQNRHWLLVKVLTAIPSNK